MDKKIAFIQTWIGSIPDYFEAHLLTCSYQKNIDFYIFTDQIIDYTLPSYKNVFIHTISIKDIEKRISKALNKDIKILNPKKACELKSTFGDIYSDYVKEYDYVGCYDIDTLMGDLYSWLSPYFGEYDFISSGGRNFHNRLSGTFMIWKNNEKINTIYKNLDFEGIMLNPEICGFEEGDYSDYVLENFKVKIIHDSQNLDDNDGSVYFEGKWDSGKSYCGDNEIMFYHFYNKQNTTFYLDWKKPTQIYALYEKNTIDDFVWVFGFTEDYSNTGKFLIESIYNYSNRKCLIYGINFDYQIPEKHLHNKQFISKRINIEKGKIDRLGRDENIISCKPKLMVDAIDFLPNLKFIFIDSDILLTASADGISRYFNELENYPLINQHTHDTLYMRGLKDGEMWTDTVGILSEAANIPICVYPRRKTNIMLFDSRSKWFFEEQLEIYNQYRDSRPGIFALHDEDSANVILSKHNLQKSLHLCDIENETDIDISKYTDLNNPFHRSLHSNSLILPKHKNEVYVFHQMKTADLFKGVENDYGNKVLSCEDILVQHAENTVFFRKNSFLSTKQINENVDFIIKNKDGSIHANLLDQNLFNYNCFYISNINLDDEYYFIEIVKTNSKQKIYNNLLKIKK